MDYNFLFLKSLAITVLIETSVLVIFFRLILRAVQTRISSLLFTGFLASFATLPYLWFIIPNYIDNNIWYITIGESFAVLVEALIICAILKTKYPTALLASLACNMVSFGTGLLLSWP